MQIKTGTDNSVLNFTKPTKAESFPEAAESEKTTGGRLNCEAQPAADSVYLFTCSCCSSELNELSVVCIM